MSNQILTFTYYLQYPPLGVALVSLFASTVMILLSWYVRTNTTPVEGIVQSSIRNDDDPFYTTKVQFERTKDHFENMTIDMTTRYIPGDKITCYFIKDTYFYIGRFKIIQEKCFKTFGAYMILYLYMQFVHCMCIIVYALYE